MKLMGIDYGSKRIGVAVSDQEGTMAFPKMTLPNDKMLMTDIVSFIKKEHIQGVVVGESKNLSGVDNPIMQKVRVFVADLEREVSVPIHFEPEFYSSVEARRLSEDTESPQQQVDAQAAAIILNSYILKKKNI